MLGPQLWHPSILPMKNYYLDKSKGGTKRLNLVLEYAKFGDVSKVTLPLISK
jgi:hypothetical protein